ncbi:hypothetical protein GCM10010121_095870 [Streptomyces brasiliensis]|uniref:Uncharacterized protein n=1 Tax=Streptomyces brasiliensis TaxID=1954 RepID=A0A917PBT0_9ACTN|nr:hypothetical protein GCM10010121_095870 [Streptomyces brasiliensis]
MFGNRSSYTNRLTVGLPVDTEARSASAGRSPAWYWAKSLKSAAPRGRKVSGGRTPRNRMNTINATFGVPYTRQDAGPEAGACGVPYGAAAAAHFALVTCKEHV